MKYEGRLKTNINNESQCEISETAASRELKVESKASILNIHNHKTASKTLLENLKQEPLKCLKSKIR